MTTHSTQPWLASGLLLGSIIVLYVLMLIPQSQADALTYSGLFAGLVLALGSLATFAGIQVRKAVKRRALTNPESTNATRQGLEIALLATSSLFLLGFNGLSWWEAGLLTAAMIFAEVALSLGKNPFAKES